MATEKSMNGQRREISELERRKVDSMGSFLGVHVGLGSLDCTHSRGIIILRLWTGLWRTAGLVIFIFFVGIL